MVVVTGATGHLGTVLVQQLVKRGENIRYITRNGPGKGLAGLDAEAVIGDICDAGFVNQVVRGADVLYHCAAYISILPGDWTTLNRINIEGTRTLLASAKENKVRRFVHIASIEAFPLGSGVRPVTEEQPIDPERTAIEYGRSKALGMLEVLRAHGQDLDCVVCCPTAFIGPPDYRLSPIGQVIFDYLHRGLPAYVEGGFDFVDVRDIADGLVRAAEHGKPGRIYLLSGRFASIPDLMDLIQSASGVKKPALRLPQWILKPLMPGIEFYYRATGRPPQFTRGSLRLLSLNVTVDSSRARDELGYNPRPLEETVKDTVDWLRQEGP